MMKKGEQDTINYDKLSTLTMLALNTPFLTDPHFKFDQDLTSDALDISFPKKKKIRSFGSTTKVISKSPKVLFDNESNGNENGM